MLMVLGMGLWGLGVWMERRRRWIPAAWLLQCGGLVVLLGALLHSEEAWGRATTGGLVVGLIAVLTPPGALSVSVRRNRVMPGVVLGLSFAFFGVALWRATTLDGNVVIWLLDLLLLVVGSVLVAVLRRPGRARALSWSLGGFVAALYVTLILVVVTAAGPLGLQEHAFLGLDLWLVLTAALTLWGIHGAPEHLRRGWYPHHLALCVALGIPFGFMTGAVVLEAPDAVTALLVAGIGAAGLSYALSFGIGSMLWTSSAALMAAAWFYGVEQAGGLGAVLALGFTAGLLFWLSTRVGAGGDDI